ncbi:MAG: aminotransferase class I/II-fold pyridoxal phosphate-dependent enzyme [Pseudanabaenaceae cyanobacterium]
MRNRVLRTERHQGREQAETLWVGQRSASENVVQAARRLGCLPEELLDFASNLNPLGIAPALRQLWRSTEAWRLLQLVQRYPDPEYTLLRQAIAEAMGIAAEGVIPGNGTAEVLGWVAQEIAALEVEQVLTLAPHSYQLNQALQTVGRSPVYVPGLWASEETVLAKVVAQTEGKSFAMLASNPHNPTGQLYSRELWQQILALPNCALLVVDESLLDFCGTGIGLLAEVARHPNLVVVRSLTKFYAMPGLRLGFAAVGAEQGSRWEARRLPWNINVVAEQAALACLQDWEYPAAVRVWLPPARDRLYRGLQAIQGLTPYHSSAHFLLVRCDRRAQEWQEFLLYRHRILVKAGSSFAGLGDRHLRVGVRPLSEQDRLLAALAEAKLH